MDMTESKEREAYRKKCRHYGVEGNCRGLSKCGHGCAYDVMCSEDAQCRRMKRYDKEHKEENE